MLRKQGVEKSVHFANHLHISVKGHKYGDDIIDTQKHQKRV